MLGVCLLLGVALAPLFCGEVQSAVSHCTRQGRGRLAAAKVGAALRWRRWLVVSACDLPSLFSLNLGLIVPFSC